MDLKFKFLSKIPSPLKNKYLITFIVFLAKPSIEEDNQWGNKPEHSTSNYSLGNNPKDW